MLCCIVCSRWGYCHTLSQSRCCTLFKLQSCYFNIYILTTTTTTIATPKVASMVGNRVSSNLSKTLIYYSLTTLHPTCFLVGCKRINRRTRDGSVFFFLLSSYSSPTNIPTVLQWLLLKCTSYAMLCCAMLCYFENYALVLYASWTMRIWQVPSYTCACVGLGWLLCRLHAAAGVPGRSCVDKSW